MSKISNGLLSASSFISDERLETRLKTAFALLGYREINSNITPGINGGLTVTFSDPEEPVDFEEIKKAGHISDEQIAADYGHKNGHAYFRLSREESDTEPAQISLVLNC